VPNRSPDSVSIDLADGRTLDARQPETPGESLEVKLIHEVSGREFESCPICGQAATDDEHVPPESVGGKVMTRTCGPCNNVLGSRVEADLTDWYDNALVLPRFAAPGVQGNRSSGRILVRTNDAGDFMLLMNGRYDRAIAGMLNSGQVDLMALRPDENRYRIALLKHAYLAACMKFGVPQGRVADDVRRDLVAARDAVDRWTVPRSRLAFGLTVLRRHEPLSIVVPPVVWATAYEGATSYEGVLLAGWVFSSWPPRAVEDHSAQAAPEIRIGLQVGGRVDGVVASADGT
jgi:hypothetical protein